MKNKIFIKAIAMVAAASSLITLSGCSATFTSEDVKGYPLVQMLSQQEIIDYYVRALDYDAVVSKNIEVHRTDYELRDVDSSRAQMLRETVAKIEEMLSKTDYSVKAKDQRLLSEDTFNYVKVLLDSYKLSNSSITDIKGALGYYFVDVTYDVAPQTAGKFKENVDMLGLDGVWVVKADGTYEADEAYLSTAVASLNNYFIDNEIDFEAEADIEKGLLTIKTLPEGTNKIKKAQRDEILNGGSKNNNNSKPNSNTGDTTSNTTTSGDETSGSENTSGENSEETTSDEDDNTPVPGVNIPRPNETESSSGSDTSDTSGAEEGNPGGATSEPQLPEVPDVDDKGDTVVSNSITPDSRKVHLDIAFINQIVGSTLNQSSFLPDLDLVYEKPETGLGGYGIYPEGSNGLRIFGYDRSSLSGKITLRYVFKDSVDGTAGIEGINIYCKEQDMSTGFNVTDKNVVLPNFLMSQLQQLIERADRVQANCDLPGMMNENIYEDKGYALLRGYSNMHVNTLKYMSKIRQVISRDMANNAYLLEVETTVTDGPCSVDVYGTYTDRSYVVVQQLANKFIITDSVRISRKIATEADIDPDTATLKRLVALNLSGSISDESKEEIRGLLSELYTAGSNRILRGPRDIQNGSETVTIERGMYDCFDNDVTMLNTEKLEYMNSQLRNILIKYGTNTSSLYTGTVTEWIGGYTNQAEFTTEELVTYAGTGEGHYMQVYYLVSKMNDTWVIDERTIIDEYKVEGNELENIKARVGQ